VDSGNLLNLGWSILGFQIVYFALSIRKIDMSEFAAVLFIGRGLYIVSSGPALVPFGICELRRVTRKTIQAQFPGDPEIVDKTGANIVTPGMIAPIRVTTGSWETISEVFKTRLATAQGDPINQRMTPEVSGIIRFRVSSLKCMDFLVNIGSIEEAIKQMRDLYESVLKIQFAKRTAPLIIADLEEMNRELTEKLIAMAEDTENKNRASRDWGIEITSASIVDVDFGREINTRLKEVSAAKLYARRIVIDAEAQKQKRIFEGEGEQAFETSRGIGLAEAKKALLLAEALGIEALARTAGTSEGKIALQLQTIRDFVEKAQYSVLPPDVYGLVAGLQETLKKVKSS